MRGKGWKGDEEIRIIRTSKISSIIIFNFSEGFDMSSMFLFLIRECFAMFSCLSFRLYPSAIAHCSNLNNAETNNSMDLTFIFDFLLINTVCYQVPA